MKCLLDLDGVLVDFVVGACKFHKIENPYLNESFRGVWDFVEKLNIPANQFWSPLGEKFWSELDWLPDGQAILKLIESKFSEVCLLTRPCMTPGCASGKIKWINNNLPKYREKYLIGSGKEFCAHPGSVLVDDSDANIVKFVEHKGHGVLVPRIWNSLNSKKDYTVEHIAQCLDLL